MELYFKTLNIDFRKTLLPLEDYYLLTKVPVCVLCHLHRNHMIILYPRPFSIIRGCIFLLDYHML